jgi:hypothetical protein
MAQNPIEYECFVKLGVFVDANSCFFARTLCMDELWYLKISVKGG